jgi:hypothetical protein
MGGVNQADNASREVSTSAGDIPLHVTRAVPDNASNIHRQTPFGGGDGCWAPFPTFDLLDNEIGKDEVLPEDTQTPEEISTSEVKWFPCRPPTNPYPSPRSRVVWSISNPPMEPLFMEVLTDNLGVLGINPAGEGLTLNLSLRDGSDNKTFFASNPEVAEKSLPSPNEDAMSESSFSLGDSLVRIFEIFALIADHLTREDLEILAITSTGLRKFVWGYMCSEVLQLRNKVPEFALAEQSLSFYELKAIHWKFLGQMDRLRLVENLGGQKLFAPTSVWLPEVERKRIIVSEIFCLMLNPLITVDHQRFWPQRTKRILYKLWILMKLPDNYYWLWIMQNRKLWPDKDVCLAWECINSIDATIKAIYVRTG